MWQPVQKFRGFEYNSKHNYCHHYIPLSILKQSENWLKSRVSKWSNNVGILYSFITVLCCDDYIVSLCCLEQISDYHCGTRLTGTESCSWYSSCITLCNCTNMHVVLHSMESIFQSVTAGCGRSHKSTKYFKTSIIKKITRMK